MSVKISEFKNYTGTEAGGIGANSVDTTEGECFVSVAGNIVSKATASTAIAGVSLTRKVYASDNQTVAQARLNYIPSDVDVLYAVTISGGTITAADEGKYYNLLNSVTVDGSTETANEATVNAAAAGTTPVVKMQLQLVKFVSATNSLFKIVV